MLARLAGAVRHAPMFRDRGNAIATSVLGAALLYVTWRFASWALVNAVWTLPDGNGSALCRAAQGRGACWAVIGERIRFIGLGSYPYGEQWRPALVCLLFVALYAAATVRVWWKPWFLVAWIAVTAAAVALLQGGIAGLVHVPSEAWGGLPLTFLLSTNGFAAAFPLAVALALGRRSQMPVLRAISIGYIELVRGVPLITFLFMASVMFPLFVPQGVAFDKVFRAQMAFVMVIAAYVAEVVRAGLDAVPAGQHEAATSLGLSFWRTTILVVLPQALRVAIPALVNTFIAFFKDTALVSMIGLLDLLGAAKAVIADAKWVGFGVEVYLFVAAVYFVFCYAVSRYSQHLEQALVARGHR
jgi:general L-amino acid transport system permease protein